MYLFPLLHIYLFNVFWHIFEGFLFLPANEFLLVLAVLKIVHRDICIVVLLLLLFSPPVFFSSVSSTKQISYLPATLAYPVLHSSQTHAVVFFTQSSAVKSMPQCTSLCICQFLSVQPLTHSLHMVHLKIIRYTVLVMWWQTVHAATVWQS